MDHGWHHCVFGRKSSWTMLQELDRARLLAQINFLSSDVLIRAKDFLLVNAMSCFISACFFECFERRRGVSGCVLQQCWRIREWVER